MKQFFDTLLSAKSLFVAALLGISFLFGFYYDTTNTQKEVCKIKNKMETYDEREQELKIKYQTLTVQVDHIYEQTKDIKEDAKRTNDKLDKIYYILSSKNK